MTLPLPTPDLDRERHELLERLRAATELLESIGADRALLADLPPAEQRRLIQAAGQVFHPDTASRRRLVKTVVRLRRAGKARRDDGVLAETGIRTLRRQTVFTTPSIFPPREFEPRDIAPGDTDALESRAAEIAEPAPGNGTHASAESARTVEPRACYICKRHYTAVHHFYDRLCTACGDLNFTKRTELADLRGRVALLTGGRVKIGYQAGLKLLRAGAHLIVTTRFPRDSAARYAREVDFGEWGSRLEIFGLDLRHTPSVEVFCREMLATRARLDFIVNNACQTVRRPPGFYAHMMAGEAAALHEMPEHVRKLLGEPGGQRVPDASGAAALDRSPDVAGLARAAELSQIPLVAEDFLVQREMFPAGRLDQDLQQVDLRGRNSWRLLMAEVPPVELLEVHLVNAIAPFILNARLKPLMLRAPGRDRHIVNVSAVEGQFYRSFKTTRHPHTNMAKAALNMMTRTSATDYHGDGIHMNSVDTGWVTDEDPLEIAERKTAEHRFHPPLDIVDGAARIVDPIMTGIRTGHHVWGQFLKDYQPTDW